MGGIEGGWWTVTPEEDTIGKRKVTCPICSGLGFYTSTGEDCKRCHGSSEVWEREDN